VAAYAYDRLFEIFTPLHLGFWLDVFDNSHIRIGMVCFCLTAVILFAVASAIRSKVWTALAVVVLTIGFEAHRVRPLKVSSRSDGRVAIALVENIPRLAHVPIRLRVLAPWREDMGARHRGD
jgi:hypothetical protein